VGTIATHCLNSLASLNSKNGLALRPCSKAMSVSHAAHDNGCRNVATTMCEQSSLDAQLQEGKQG
jgi:hypothetical protein